MGDTGPVGAQGPGARTIYRQIPFADPDPVLVDTSLANLVATCDDVGNVSLGVSGPMMHGFSATGDFPNPFYRSRGKGGDLTSLFDPNRITLVFTFVDPATRKSQQVNLDYTRQAGSGTCLLTGQVIPGS